MFKNSDIYAEKLHRPKHGYFLIRDDPYVNTDQCSTVGIVCSYRQDGLGTESRREREFPHPSRPAMGPIQPLVQWVLGFFLGVKQPGHDVPTPTLHLAVRLKKEHSYISTPPLVLNGLF